MTSQCSFCGAWREEVDRLVAGPLDAAICDRCIQRAVLRVAPNAPAADACTFCKVEPAYVVSVRRAHRICRTCLDLCVEILREDNFELDAAPLPRATLRPPR